MFKKWLSAYNFKYPRSLVYMLQASEYDVRDYLAWHRQAEDFRKIEYRKSLVKTSKANALLYISWIILIAIILLDIFLVASDQNLNRIIFAALTMILLPYILAYGILVPLFIIKMFIQLPIERRIVNAAKIKLAAHRGLKIGIAGSYGKTTMREILKTVLSEGKKVAAPPHSYNTVLGISQFIDTLNGDEDILIFELGEYYPGDVRKLCQFVKPNIGVITGINEAHLQKFKSLDRTVKTIFELADYLGDKTVYVNSENSTAARNACKGHVLYSRESIGDWKILNARTDLNGTSFEMIGNGGQNHSHKIELTSKLLGLHQVGPLAAAIDLALKLGLTIEQVVAGVAKTKPFDHRLEPRTDSSGVITLDDSYNGNPDGVTAVIAFLASLKDHRRFYVTPGLVEMGPRTKDVHEEIGRQLAEAEIEKVILIKNSVTPHIEKGLKDNNYKGDIIWFDQALKAFNALSNLTVKDDVVLLQNDWPDQYR